MALSGDLTTFDLQFGAYTDAVGLAALVAAGGKLFAVDPSTNKKIRLTHITSGQVIVPDPVDVTIGEDGTGVVTGIPHTGQATISPAGYAWRVEWNIASNKPSPGNLTFVVPSGATADFDLLVPAATVPAVAISQPTVASVNGQTGAVSLDAADVGAASAGDLAGKADLVGGKLPESQVPARLSDVELRAASVAAGRDVFAATLTSDGSADQSARVNAVLSEAPPAGTKRLVRLVGDFSIKSPLIVYSNTTLDLTHAVLNVPTGQSINAVQNAAYKVTARGVVDGVISAAATTLTSATAAFTSGDVGKAISVQGAGLTGGPLVTTIASVTNGTTVELAAASTAASPAAGSYVAIGPRDTNITVRGGRVQRNGSGGVDGNTRHGMVFQRVDRLTVEDITLQVLNGKYAIMCADVTDVHARRLHFDNTTSDGFHVNGPAARVTVADCTGQTSDDFVAFLCDEGSTYTQYRDTKGDLDNITVRNIQGGSTTCLVKVQADATSTNGVGTIFVSDIKVDPALSSTGVRAVRLSSGSGINGLMKMVTLRNIYGRIGVYDQNAAGGVIEYLSIENFACPPLAANDKAIVVPNGAVVRTMRVQGARGRHVNSQNSLVFLDNTATIDHLIVADADWGGGTSTCLVQMAAAGTVIRTLTINSTVLENTGNTGSLVGTLAGCTLSRLNINSVELRAAANAVTFICSTIVTVNGLRTNATGFQVSGGYSITVRGSGIEVGSSNTSTGSTRPFSFGYTVDISLAGVLSNALFYCYNTNAALSCGAGPVACDGAGNWRNVATGATYVKV